MSKSLKKVALIVGVAALAVTGIGLLVAPTAVGLGFTALGGVSAFAANIGLTTLLSIGSLALSIGSMPSPPQEQTGANERGTAYFDTNALAAFVFGETAVPRDAVAERSAAHPSQRP